MKTIIRNGTVVTGDGETVLEGATIVIEGDTIRDVLNSNGSARSSEQDLLIDATDRIVIPGVINQHAHCITQAPAHAHGSQPASREKALHNLNRHLLQGTTSILSLDGFATQEETRAFDGIHPMRVFGATGHTNDNLAAALLADGSGLKDVHKHLTVEQRLHEGAVLIGEIAGGGTTGGGAQEYQCIPDAVERAAGVRLTTPQARLLKEAILGPYLHAEDMKPERVQQLLEEFGLTITLSLEEVVKLICDTVMPSYQTALTGIRGSAELASRLDELVTVHVAPPTEEVLREISWLGPRLIAAHCNHPHFSIDRAVGLARDLKAAGVIVDACTLDAFGARVLNPTPDHFFALFEEGVVDVVGTDYAAGNHSSILAGLQGVIDNGLAELPEAIAKATGNVARAIPKMGMRTGLLKPGNLADIVIARRGDISQVEAVMIGGSLAVWEGQLVH